MESENEPLLGDSAKRKCQRQRSQLHWYHYVGDFFNILKAFIGTNYQALPFAFANSGVIPGVLGVFFIATLTDHCCQKMIECKRYLVEKLSNEAALKQNLSPAEAESLQKNLSRTVSYGDLGLYVYGRWCSGVIEFCVWFTQYTTCISYLVFIGNTIFEIYPLTPALVPITNGTPMVNESWGYDSDRMSHHPGEGVPMLAISHLLPSTPDIDNISDNSTTPHPAILMLSTAPSLMFIIMFPLGFFIVTSFIRKLRSISPFSAIATVALTIGAGAVFIYLVVGFNVCDDWRYAKLFTMPLFIGQLISAYEGIGCLIPIESSMEGNRHVFPRFLHASVYLVFVVLCAFGLIGYLRFGSQVQQIIVLNIPQHQALSIFVDVTLIISVLFTYPLQCFPVIEITEQLVFGYTEKPKKCVNSLEYDEIDEPAYLPPNQSIQGLQESDLMVGHLTTDNMNVDFLQTVASWKRNVLRLFISLSIAGFAVLLRDNFAYLASFTGAVGCSILAFILPCMINLRLKMNELSTCVIIRDVLIICFSIICSLLTLAVIFDEIATGQIHA